MQIILLYRYTFMLAHLKGTILMKTEKFAVIDCNGVGYKVFIGSATLKKLPKNGETASLWTHLHVREDAQDLYGFSEYAELEFFEMLIGISGIGPKSALGVMAIAGIDTLKRAIAAGESSYLTKVSGIGKKTAEKIILELKDKLGGAGISGDSGLQEDGDVLQALQSLGYSLNETREAMKGIPPEIQGVNNRIKFALKNLGK